MPDTPADAARSTAENLGEQAVAAASEVADEAKDQARRAAETGKRAAGGRLDRVAAALHASADQLAGEEDWLADVIESAAGRIEAASTHLQEENIDGLTEEACTFARRHPAMFLGGAVALGFALSRIAKASDGPSAPNSGETS